MTKTIEAWMDGPVGRLRLLERGGALVGLYFEEHRNAPAIPATSGATEALDEARRQLDAYFEGRRQRFELPLAPVGTELQREVWRALAAIPFGQTRSYAAIARAIGRPRAVRAVGAANASNPISIVVPCHRVIASDGALTGYAGGLDAKRWLLAHERGRELTAHA